MNHKTTETPELVMLSVRVTKEAHEGLKRAAASEYRAVAAEIRRLIEVRVAEFEAEQKRAA